MSVLVVALVALGGALGAAVRFEVATRLDGRHPLGTLAVNVLGSLLLGVAAAASLGEEAWALVATGFCGALTTYAAFAVQTVRLGPLTPRAAAYAVATVVLALGAVTLGYAAGSALG